MLGTIRDHGRISRPSGDRPGVPDGCVTRLEVQVEALPGNRRDGVAL
jgi:hypothetical protein